MKAEVKERLERWWREPGPAVRGWKQESGGTAVGLLHTDVPEELVWAAGALPVTVLAREVAFQHADRHFQPFACAYSRSVIELYEQGDLDYLDGLVVPYACDTTRCLDLVFKYAGRFKFHDCLRLPKRVTAEGVRKYFRAELSRLAASLEKLTGREVTAEGLRSAIREYNRLRGLLQQLRLVLREGREGLSAEEYFSAVRAAMVQPPPESAALLESAVSSLGSAGRAKGLPVVVAGKVPSPPGLIPLLESAGLWIVEDHLVVGGRWVEAQAAESGDPWAALTERQLSRLPFSGIWDSRPSRAAYLLERAAAVRAVGAVFLVQKFCEPAEMDLPGIREEAEKAGLPVLHLETDYAESSLETVKTRVEAFAEMLHARQS